MERERKILEKLTIRQLYDLNKLLGAQHPPLTPMLDHILMEVCESYDFAIDRFEDLPRYPTKLNDPLILKSDTSVGYLMCLLFAFKAFYPRIASKRYPELYNAANQVSPGESAMLPEAQRGQVISHFEQYYG